MARATCPEHCATVGPDASVLSRYGDLVTEAGDVIVYDDEVEDAWIQSDVHCSRDDRR